ncbi:hypothetical protein U9M48_013251, partial [Paspalum notatum var. saurae]
TTGSRSRRRSTVDREADDKWNPKQEDDVSPSAYQIMIKDDYGGLEVAPIGDSIRASQYSTPSFGLAPGCDPTCM